MTYLDQVKWIKYVESSLNNLLTEVFYLFRKQMAVKEDLKSLQSMVNENEDRKIISKTVTFRLLQFLTFTEDVLITAGELRRHCDHGQDLIQNHVVLLKETLLRIS